MPRDTFPTESAHCLDDRIVHLMNRIALHVTAMLTVWVLASTNCHGQPAKSDQPMATIQMQAIYDQIKTPYKYGIVIEPPNRKKVDCPTVFRHGEKWYMIYVQLEKSPEEGYTTQLAQSDDLLHWKPLGTILDRGDPDAWDSANAGGGIALFDTKWGGTNSLQTFEDHYWLSYMGGNKF